MSILTRLAVAASALALWLSPAAEARERGDILVRGGVALVAPNDSSSDVRINGATVPGTGVAVGDGYAAGATLNWMFADHFAVEVLAATPFTHRLSGEGLGIDRIGEVTQLPPTVSLQWFPRAGSARVQPYFGVGVTAFLSVDEDLSGEFENALGRSSLEVDHAFGLSTQLGIDVRLDRNWSVNAALWYIDLDTEATIRTQTTGFERIDVDVDIDPVAWMLGVTYRF